MGESSIGATVPFVKAEALLESSAGPPVPPPLQPAEEDVAMEDADKDILCPICMQIIKDAFLTACGHSFCYVCLVTHLRNKSDCPSCGHYLTTAHIFPNFLLDKCLKKTSASRVAKTASPFEHFRQALQQGLEVSIKELDDLLSLLSEKKRKMEQEEAETNMQIMLSFLHCLRKQKLEELTEIQSDLQYIKEDINAVERRRIDLYREKERFSGRMRMLVDDPIAEKASPSFDKHANGINYSVYSAHTQMGSGSSQNKKPDANALANFQALQRKGAYGAEGLQSCTPSGLALERKRQVYSQFNDLQECYLQKRRNWIKHLHKGDERSTKNSSKEDYSPGLEDFQSVLNTFTRYSRLRVIAELRHGDIFQSANILSSIEFDRDDEFFATAGVSRRIKVFEFSSVVNEPADIHCPIVEMPTRCKLSCLSWNKYTKSHIASSDYEGIVTVWDVTTRQSVMEYEEHEKRAWSVDFSRSEPAMLVSGSDDCKVKIWCTRQEASVLNIDMKANICSVKYNPGSSIYVAVGSADRHIHYYDLRNISQPLHVFSGHMKAVSYVKFLSNTELASASTDSTLRLWDVKDNLPLCTYRGHTNEKNFVGLTVNSEYISCGSETNEVFVYHKAISKPMACHKFSSSGSNENEDDAGSYFISAVCWKSDSPTMLTANSGGTIKVLVLAP
ncbi:E3 ubiquitin-protein ligase COP1 [Morus notabilis]|uniref:E3 ubiquitin-protein ligase COP1 n=1 Tax=Morus notabilis TaxID=981085 RepID=W9R960_9ROSA|nr:E3 ubiquitin-protein ligase COP1 [Morus notabilis]EXB77009.1 E3 ubiquitin-protein ligase COP1 [Morus notabilis]